MINLKKQTYRLKEIIARVGVFMQKGFEKKLLLLIYIIFWFIVMSPVIYSAELKTTASAAILIDQISGQVLHGENIHKKLPPASLTKVLTAVVAMENCNLNEIVTVSRRAAYQEGSSIYLEEGEKISLEELLYAILLSSGNDAAVAIAEHVASSVEDFALLMNLTAKKAGAINSNFVNPSGLPDIAHYSTAYDLAMITRYAFNYRKFAEITATKNKTISWSGHNWGRGLHNHNKMLWTYSGATGGKTGYTKAAGRCLITTASKKNRNFVAVVLNCSSDWYEVAKLLDYGFDSFKKKTVINKGDKIVEFSIEEGEREKVSLLAAESLELLVENNGSLKLTKEIYYDDSISLPIKKGDIIGVMIIKNNNFEKKINLKAEYDIDYNSKFKKFWRKISNFHS